jgi:hypothetical protein
LDLNRLSRGEQILGVCSALLFLLSFFPLWAKYEASEEAFGAFATTQRFSAWSAAFNFLMKLGIILALIALVLIIVKAAGGLDNVQMPAPLGLIYLGLAGLSFLLLLLFTLIGPEESEAGVNVQDFGIEASRGPLLFVGVLLGAGMAVGAYLHFQQEGRATTVAPRQPGPPPGPPPAPPPGA